MAEMKFPEFLTDGAFHLQYFDKDVDEWIDFEEDLIEDLKDSLIIKVRAVTTKPENSEEEYIKCTTKNTPEVLSTTDEHPSTLSSFIEEAPLPALATPKRQISRSFPLVSNSPEETAERPVMSADAKPDEQSAASPITTTRVTPTRKLWPRLFKLPKEVIPRSVLEKLESQQSLNTSERRLLLESFYHAATQYEGGFYPTSRMYDDMVDCLLREYPYLLNVGGLPATSAREFWKDKLVFKFGNSRKRLDKSHPEVMQKRKKEKDSKLQSPSTPTRGNTFTWGLENYLPPVPVTEDETSHDLHVKWLQREYKKTSADIDISTKDLKMELTFAHRRKMIVGEGIGILELLEKYPWLLSYQEILAEFERLKPRTTNYNIEELLSSGLQKYRKAIVSQLIGKKKPEFLVEMEKTKNSCRTESQRNYADDCITLVGLPLLFKEKPDKLVKLREEANAAIQIHVKDKILSVNENAFAVKLEGTLVFECDNFFQAFCGCIACIYVFNLVYPKELTKYFTFIQNILIGVKDDDGNLKFDKKILSVLSQLNLELNHCSSR